MVSLSEFSTNDLFRDISEPSKQLMENIVVDQPTNITPLTSNVASTNTKPNTAYVAFVRYDAISQENDNLVMESVINLAGMGDAFIFVSSKDGDDARDNKLLVLESNTSIKKHLITSDKTKNVFGILSEMYKLRFENVVLVTESANVGYYKEIVNKYNGINRHHGYYNFSSIDVVGAGKDGIKTTKTKALLDFIENTPSKELMEFAEKLNRQGYLTESTTDLFHEFYTINDSVINNMDK